MTVPYEIAERVRLRKSQYCGFLDTKQWDALREVLAADFTATFYNPDGSVFVEFETPEKLLEGTIPPLDGGQSSHLVGNEELELISNTEVSAIFAMRDYLVPGPESSMPFSTLHGYGHYHERWVERDGDWYLKTMKLTRTIVDYGLIP